MSNKSKSKKLSVPRVLAAIQQDYQQKVFALGQLQYQIDVFTAETIDLIEKIRAINNEAAARKQLDAQKASETTPEAGAQ